MEMHEIRAHWDSLAKKHRLDLKSTTKTPTIKQLEISAIARAIDSSSKNSQTSSMLEVGCGNGHNIFGLARLFPHSKFHGIDYSGDMITAACKLKEELPHCDLEFSVGDVLNLSAAPSLKNSFDFVITDRLLINLNTWELQQQGIKQLSDCIKENGFLITIENFMQSYSNQNQLRELIGLPSRSIDPYNKFINEKFFEEFIIKDLGFEFIYSENFGSLHDLILYVLLPHINDGKVVYDHPLMESVTSLLERLPKHFSNCFGDFGQNKLYIFKKR